MNIYEKIQTIRVELRNMNLKMTGKNTYAGYSYFELDDILPSINRLMQKYQLTAIVSFDKELATMTVVDYESGDADIGQEFQKIFITSPFGSADLKGCHEVQSIGAVETYQRRYLYQALFDIGENDSLNATNGKEEARQKQPPRQSEKAPAPSAPSAPVSEKQEQEALNYVLTFSKYKGTALKDCPLDFLKWGRDRFDGELKKKIDIVIAYAERNAPKQLAVDDDDGEIPF